MFFNYLLPKYAQIIVDRIMKVLPYNINVMDQDGVIIASGDKKRVNIVHKGAIKALKFKEPYLVYKDTETEKKGINLPIMLKDSIVGVIGISGDVEEVMVIGQIVVITAQLMIENQLYHEMNAIKKSRIQDFLFEWLTLEENEYTEEFIARAHYRGINLKIKRSAVILTFKDGDYHIIEYIKSKLERDEYIVRQKSDEVMVLVIDSKALKERMEAFVKESENDALYCYVGEPSAIASEAAQKAVKIKESVNETITKERVVFHSNVALETILYDVEKNSELLRLSEIFAKQDLDGSLAETICIYIKYTDDQLKVCNELFIHRNTLNYRLAKIGKLTGKNPRVVRDLMLLYAAIVQK